MNLVPRDPLTPTTCKTLGPSPTALRSPLSPKGERAEIKTQNALSRRERGDRKAVGEGPLSSQSTLTEP